MELEQALAKIASLEGTVAALKQRQDQLVTQKNDARAEATEATRQLAEVEAARGALERSTKAHESVAAQLAEYQKKEASWHTERELMGAGITDPEGLDFVKLAYNRIPEADRPKEGIGAWIKGDRDTLPRGLHAYLPTVEGVAPAGAKPPAANSGVARHGNGAAQLTAQQVAASTGSEWRSSREAEYAALGMTAPPLPSKG